MSVAQVRHDNEGYVMSGRLGPDIAFLSVLASLPLVLTLVVSSLVCLRQRKRRPCSARLLGGASLAYLIWVTVGRRTFVAIVQLAAPNFSISEHGEFVWAAAMIALNAIPATLSALIWGCALWAVLIVDEDKSCEIRLPLPLLRDGGIER